MSLIKKLTLPNHLYKKLEYIKFSGTEYLYLPFDITSTYAYYDLKAKINGTGTVMGYHVTGNSTNPYNFWYRCSSSTSSTKSLNCEVFHREGSAYNYESYTASVPNDTINNIKYLYDTSNYKYMVTNAADDTTISSLISNTQFLYGKTTLNSFGFYLGAINDGNDTFSYYGKMNVYNFYLNTNADSGQNAQWAAYANTNFIPVQRISDNVCGLYDTKHKVFYSMSGTEITTNAAGPWLGTFIDDTENPLILDPQALNCYKNGDTYANTSYYNVAGYITSGSKEMIYTVVVPKNLSNITSVTVNKFRSLIRGTAGYINGSAYIDYAASESGYTITTYISSLNTVTIKIVATSALSGATNNTVLQAAFTSGDLSLTFNITTP